jgi:hypothetical protein
MMSSHIRRILKLGLLMGDMVVSAAGCFVFVPGFRAVAMGLERPDARTSMRADGRSTRRLAGIGAALFLLAFVASEAAATVVSLRH